MPCDLEAIETRRIKARDLLSRTVGRRATGSTYAVSLVEMTRDVEALLKECKALRKENDTLWEIAEKASPVWLGRADNMPYWSTDHTRNYAKACYQEIKQLRKDRIARAVSKE